MIGSFLNVVIWRVPRHESIVRPPSHCPGCDTEIAALRQHPGRSRGSCCGAAAGTAAPGSRSATRSWSWPARRCGSRWRCASGRPGSCRPYLVLVSALLALSLIDFDTFLLPNRIVYPLSAPLVVLFGLAASLDDAGRDYVRALLGGLAAFAVLLHRPPHRAPGDGLRRREAQLLARRRARLALVGLGVPRALPRLPARRGHRRAAHRDQGADAGATTCPFGPFLAAGTVLPILVRRSRARPLPRR